MEGPGLPYVAFSQAISLFPGSSFWAIIFFMSLAIMGLSTMITLLEGIVLPLQKNISIFTKRPNLVPGKNPYPVTFPILTPSIPALTGTPAHRPMWLSDLCGSQTRVAQSTLTFSARLLGRTSGQPRLLQPPWQLRGVPVR